MKAFCFVLLGLGWQAGPSDVARVTVVPDLGTRQRGADWPAFLGPTGDGKSAETGLATDWPGDGPRLVWSRPLGESYGLGAVSRGRYFQCDYAAGQARLWCLESETGRLLWEYSYPSQYADLYGYLRGPRCSPVVDGTRVYVYGAEGQLHCVHAVDGSRIWSCDTAQQFGVVQNFFGVGSTPVIYEDLLVAMVGGSPPADQQIPPGQLDRVTGNGSGIVAFDKYTGQVRYQITDELASYASPRLACDGDRPWCFMFMRGGLVAFHPGTGAVDFQFPWRARLLESVNASTPVVAGRRVFISETYGPGGALLEFAAGEVRTVWSDQRQGRNKSLQAHWSTPIFHDGYLYGCSGRHTRQAELRCVNWETGDVVWSEPDLTRTSLLYVDGHFVCLGEDGTLRLIRVTPARYEQVAVAQLTEPPAGPSTVPPRPLLQHPAWAAPILSHGLLYVRGRDRVACLELIPDGP